MNKIGKKMNYLTFKSKYRTVPTIEIDGKIIESSPQILEKIKQTNSKKIAIECYPGINYKLLVDLLIKPLEFDRTFQIDEYSYSIDTINQMFEKYLTEDRVFGKMSNFQISDLYSKQNLDEMSEEFTKSESAIVYGFGASMISNYDLLIYVDITRWEIQKRFRRKEIGNWKLSNFDEDKLRRYKRGYFIEWRIADRLKLHLFDKIDLYIDGNQAENLKLISGPSLISALETISKQPFRLTPYFDPGVWGGQWMKETCNLDPQQHNYAWSFDGVPEENHITLINKGVSMDIPALNLVLNQPFNLLGPNVYDHFGAEFPIRFDFLDTIEGQNLSLQVHPNKKYIKEQFGMRYTQDESYYILESTEDSVVYLGVKENIKPNELIIDLKEAQKTNHFDVEKYINKIPVKKHDHILIPAGTIHCSGKNTMVLEISATPYIFTFKLWDWNRLGLDGLPRPIHIEHGAQVIQYDRDTKWVHNELVNQTEILSDQDGIVEERTGLHALEFIETRRFWFDKMVKHNTCNTVNVLNLVEGQQAIVESLDHAFEPFPVSYAETFIIPAAVGEYTIRPYGASKGKRIGIIKAYVRETVN
jgi:mannose-6-phosphate isomerase class I